MHQMIPFWQMAGFIFTSVLGTMLHFLFDWSGQNIIAAFFSTINESIWEHMKLIYYPMFLFGWIEYLLWGKEYKQFWCVKLMGMLLALGLIPTIFYVYTGILGKTADWFNIAIFFISAGAAFWLESRLLLNKVQCGVPRKISIILIFLIGLLFMVLTFYPPHIPLFQDPINQNYGYIPIAHHCATNANNPFRTVTNCGHFFL